jgi:hypothetical protein
VKSLKFVCDLKNKKENVWTYNSEGAALFCDDEMMKYVTERAEIHDRREVRRKIASVGESKR